MKPFCEVIVRNTLPAMRSMVATRLAERGLSGKDIAERMGVTPPAVTQYLKKSRGSALIKNEKVEKKIDELAEKLMEKELSEREKIQAFCGICRTVREEGLICELHREMAGLKECGVCPECP